jgi:diguanylate cyclase (GGDEF)-like protein
MPWPIRRQDLTGIFNRRAILKQAAEELACGRQGGSLTVGMCDVDHFKSVNDSYGHQAGDDVLKGFTALVQAQLCDCDCVGRYGGEEFLVIHPGAAGPYDASIYERLCALVAGAGMPTRKGPVAITVSIGVAAASESTVDTLLAAADEALYRNEGGWTQSGGIREIRAAAKSGKLALAARDARRPHVGRCDDRQDGPFGFQQVRQYSHSSHPSVVVVYLG